jgi:hypothetical protein
LFDKLAKAENTFFQSKTEFFSPVVHSQPVQVKLDGVVMNFKVVHEDHDAYYILRPTSYKTAEIVRQASLAEREDYLKIFPRFNAVVYRQGRRPKAVLSNAKHKNVELSGNIEILLSENMSIFDIVEVRWDGKSFWYDKHQTNVRQNFLQETLSLKQKPESLTGLPPSLFSAYELAFEDVKDKAEDRINKALLRSGGRLVSYVDRGDTYTVTYKVKLKNNQYREMTSTVKSENLQVEVAGICLSGGDNRFDLQSLVNVIREGDEQDRIVVGNYANYPGAARHYNNEEDYDYDDNDY